MTCILKSCANDSEPCCGQCEASAVLDLSHRNDGYLARALSNPTLCALREAGLVSTRPAGDGYLMVRAIAPETAPRPVTIGYRGNPMTHDHRGRWLPSGAAT